MKLETAIREAIKLYRNVFSDYCRIVEGVPVIPQIPKVEFHPGIGWHIDGVFAPGSAAEIVDGYSARMRLLAQKINDYRIGPRRTGRIAQLQQEAREADPTHRAPGARPHTPRPGQETPGQEAPGRTYYRKGARAKKV
jgi:hypothetical protein